MDGLTREAIYMFLAEVGRRYSRAANLYLLGGSALNLLGNTRSTLDIDYVGDDLQKNELQLTIDEVAHEMRIEVEAVPITGFVPIPNNAEERSVHIGRFSELQVYVFDPYTIALSKVDRGFDTDVEDVLFLIRRGDVQFERLEAIVSEALAQSAQYSLDASAMLKHLQDVRRSL
jgi:hypothetical protein